MCTFGDRLNKLVNEKELSQKELGVILNTSDATVNRYIKNKSFPDQETLKKIANYFNVSIDYLLCRTDNPNFSVVEGTYKGKTIKAIIDVQGVELTLDEIENFIKILGESYIDLKSVAKAAKSSDGK